MGSVDEANGFLTFDDNANWTAFTRTPERQLHALGSVAPSTCQQIACDGIAHIASLIKKGHHWQPGFGLP